MATLSFFALVSVLAVGTASVTTYGGQPGNIVLDSAYNSNPQLVNSHVVQQYDVNQQQHLNNQNYVDSNVNGYPSSQLVQSHQVLVSNQNGGYGVDNLAANSYSLNNNPNHNLNNMNNPNNLYGASNLGPQNDGYVNRNSLLESNNLIHQNNRNGVQRVDINTATSSGYGRLDGNAGYCKDSY